MSGVILRLNGLGSQTEASFASLATPFSLPLTGIRVMWSITEIQTMLLRAARGQPPYPKLTRTSMFALPLVRFAGLSE